MSPPQPRTANLPDRHAEWTWYHIILTTYGAWLPGDPRGFRTRHHREHVEGDYKNPPARGEHGTLETTARESLKQPPVQLSPAFRAVVGATLRERLEGLGALVVCVAVSSRHVHLLAKMPPGQVSSWTGAAKRHAWFAIRDNGWQGKLWAKRGKPVHVRNREHQLNVFRYIIEHESVGAWVWKWRGEDPN